MKLAPHTYKAWWDLHAWAGVIASLITYLMFFFGTLTLFHKEVRIWEEPRGPQATPAEVDHVIDQGIREGKISPHTMRLNFPRDGSPGFDMSYEDAAGNGQGSYIEPHGLVDASSNVADFIFGMHYLQFPGSPDWFYTLAGLAAGLLVLVVVSGVLIHLRDLVRQFHQFRPKKRLQVIWSDAHKVLGTIGLPFALVYGFTGAWMALDEPLGKSLAVASFGGDELRLSSAANGPPEVKPQAPPNTPAVVTRLPLSELMARATQEQRLIGGEERCRSVFLNDVGAPNATALFYCGDDSLLLWQRDGSRVAPPRHVPPTLKTQISRVPNELHFVDFASIPLRVVYALLGVAGCLAILTGNWLWLERRKPSWGRFLVQRLTLATGAGSLLAWVFMLLANRLHLSAHFERSVFWYGWLAVTLVCAIGRDARRHWYVTFVASGLGLLLVPVLGLVTRDRAYDAWRQVNVERAVDLSFVGLGILLLLLARSFLAMTKPQPPSHVTATEPSAHVA
jgi:uncharacterized iron-regulated membrane protein